MTGPDEPNGPLPTEMRAADAQPTTRITPDPDGATPPADTVGTAMPRATAGRQRRVPRSVWAATIGFFAIMLGFLVLYPIFEGFDEQNQLDRVYATVGGDLLPVTGQELTSNGVTQANTVYFHGYPLGLNPTWDSAPSQPRDQRPGLAALGGHATSRANGTPNPPNQMSQHPPLYYWVAGAVMWLIPGHDSIPVDQLVFWLRLLNTLILLPLPWLFYRAATHLVGDGFAARSAAFVPLVIPALGRIGATVNNDNLAILSSMAVMVSLAAVMQGDMTRRRALWVAVWLALALWTKGTALLLCPVVLIAYLIGWWRVKGRFPWRPAAVVTGGGVVGLAWWVQNLIRYHTLQPQGFGTSYAGYTGAPRTAANPFGWRGFIDTVWTNYPTRFWGQLGELEPPYLPVWLLVLLSLLLIAGFVLTLVHSPGSRLTVVVLWVVGIGAQAAVIWDALEYTRVYAGVRGLQARYGFPVAIGLLVPIGIGIALALRRHARWWPLVLSVIGFAATITSYVLWVNRMMLPKGTTLSFASLGHAFRNVARFFPFPTAVTVVLSVLAVVGLAVPLVWTLLVALRPARDGLGPDERAPDSVLAPTALAAGAA